MVVDALISRHGGRLRAHKAQAAADVIRLQGEGPEPTRVIAAIPSCFMNLSGGPTKGLAEFFSVPPAHLIVVHDELDIPYGQIRLKGTGGEGGHNGLRSISERLGTRDYLRVRVGIDRPPGRMDPAAYVLKDFSGEQKKELPFLIEDACDAVELLIARGLTDAQQVVHAPE